MPKKLKPLKGTPVKDLLDNLESKYWEEDRRNDKEEKHQGACRAQIIAHLKTMVNQDVCLNETQSKYVEVLTRNAGRRMDDKNMDILILPIATFINSIRLDCDNCLNKECELHDK